ncbi:unnamed protein product [Rotaria sordida]|uniref:Uncharacterized protein n=1 Tax=Rotaria sordida TaxID=392033 RepID=A0A818SJ39_9BILA|nr:unnamed protein product [Rotaria sordida]
MNDYDNDDQPSGCSNGSFDRITVDNREFYNLDPTSEEVLPQLSRENLLKYILSIHPAPPIYGRPCVKITLSQCSKQEWPTPLPDYIDNDELLYIRDTLFNIFMEEYDQSMKKSKIIRNNSEDKDNTDDNTTSTSS